MTDTTDDGLTQRSIKNYLLFKRFFFGPWVRHLFKAKISGQENIPAKGGILFASNHRGAMDAPILAGMIDRPVTFPAKRELFESKSIGGRIVAWFLRSTGMIPLDRSGGKSSENALRPIVERLEEGLAVGIYPEGKRSVDGRLYKGKTGVARLALEAGVPVVPVAMFDSRKHTTKLGIPWVSHPHVVVGEPLDFSEYFGLQDDYDALRWVTDQVMAAVQKLSGQEYVDVYCKDVYYKVITMEEANKHILPHPGYGEAKPPVLPKGTHVAKHEIGGADPGADPGSPSAPAE
ncbi:MAG: 1-acyl-sn-glycerol-3-phosphate acyltransferase [Propionibacteriaceae bacterium]|nr:1-acyl-sn-glycerol-3-phosphate acyltransferase [Propionibacteriaceae bacterium]